MSGFRLPWQSAPAPPAEPEPSALAPTLLSIFLCWALPAVFYLMTQTDGAKPISPTRKSAQTGTGAEVPKDVERRKVAQQEQPAQKVGLQRAMLAAAFIVPHAIVIMLQESPTVSEQVSEWARMSYVQLTDGKLTLPFQAGVAGARLLRLFFFPRHGLC